MRLLRGGVCVEARGRFVSWAALRIVYSWLWGNCLCNPKCLWVFRFSCLVGWCCYGKSAARKLFEIKLFVCFAINLRMVRVPWSGDYGKQRQAMYKVTDATRGQGVTRLGHGDCGCFALLRGVSRGGKLRHVYTARGDRPHPLFSGAVMFCLTLII